VLVKKTEEDKWITNSIGNLFHGLNVVAGDQFIIGIKELDTSFFESTLGQEKALDTRKT
jgi:hypothetical protein